MTDPKAYRASRERHARRWELLAELEKGADSTAILDEMRELDRADIEYESQLLNEIAIDHALRRGHVAHRYDEARAKLRNAMDPDDPRRRTFERLLDAAESNEPLSAEDEQSLLDFGVPEATIHEMRANQAEAQRLTERLRDFDEGDQH